MEAEKECCGGDGPTEEDGCVDEGVDSPENPTNDTPGYAYTNNANDANTNNANDAYTNKANDAYTNNAPKAANPQFIGCFCLLNVPGAVTSDGWNYYPPQNNPRGQLLDFGNQKGPERTRNRKDQKVKFDPSPPADIKRNICGLPPPENPSIPFPKPAPSVELRGGQIYSGCQCLKRDGLQDDCPRTGCQGQPSCMTFPAPICVPSGNAPEPPPPPPPKRFGMRRRGENKDRHARCFIPFGDDERFIQMGRRGYRENPPVPRGPKVPCAEHMKARC